MHAGSSVRQCTNQQTQHHYPDRQQSVQLLSDFVTTKHRYFSTFWHSYQNTNPHIILSLLLFNVLSCYFCRLCYRLYCDISRNNTQPAAPANANRGESPCQFLTAEDSTSPTWCDRWACALCMVGTKPSAEESSPELKHWSVGHMWLWVENTMYREARSQGLASEQKPGSCSASRTSASVVVGGQW